MPKITKENAREMQAKGAKARKANTEINAEKRRQRQSMQESLEILLNGNYHITSEGEASMLAKLGYEGDLTVKAMLNIGLLKSALNGSTKAYEMIVGMLGEQPVKKVEIQNNSFVDALNGIAKEVCADENIEDVINGDN